MVVPSRSVAAPNNHLDKQDPPLAPPAAACPPPTAPLSPAEAIVKEDRESRPVGRPAPGIARAETCEEAAVQPVTLTPSRRRSQSHAPTQG